MDMGFVIEKERIAIEAISIMGQSHENAHYQGHIQGRLMPEKFTQTYVV